MHNIDRKSTVLLPKKLASKPPLPQAKFPFLPKIQSNLRSRNASNNNSSHTKREDSSNNISYISTNSNSSGIPANQRKNEKSLEKFNFLNAK